ncbi:MAG TPA: sigma-70 family RNA polymerase sigma factor [Xanthomonadales bacterium]|nr:sigma-70 family RNA polymerase sigma factor [Xanthomonadales bacterium]
MNPASHEQLMLAYAAGDASAFDHLYEHYRTPLYRFILRQVRDPVSSNDIYQQCWEKVIKGRHTYRSKSPFPAWLFRIARNTVIDHFRRMAPAGLDEFTDLPGETSSPEAEVLAVEEQGQLAAAIDALPLEQREVVLLRLEAGLDLAAIADITASKPETCKSRLRYALAKLQEQMQQAGLATGGNHATH